MLLTSKLKFHSIATLVSVVAFGALSGFVILHATSNWGLTVSADTVSYLSAANTIAEGGGFYYTTPSGELILLSHWPPLYPMILSLPVYLGLDPIATMRWVNAVLSGATCILIMVTAQKFSHSALAGVFTAIIFMLGRPILEVYTCALSEPTFVSLTVLYFVIFIYYIKSRQKCYLVAAGLVLGISCLTRYTGIFFIPASCLIIYLTGTKEKWKHSIFDIVVFGFTVSIFLAPWVLRCLVLSRGLGSRTLGGTIQVLHVSYLRHFLTTIASWFFVGIRGQDTSTIYVVARICSVFAMIATFFYLFFRGWIRDGLHRILPRPAILVVFVVFSHSVIYLLFMAISISLNREGSFGNRFLSPLYPLSAMCLGVAVPGIIRKQTIRVRGIFFALSFIFFLGIGSGIWPAIEDLREYGRKYSGRFCSNSGIIRFLRQAEPDRIIYSTDPSYVSYKTGRFAHRVPAKFSRTSKLSDELFDAEVTALLRDLAEKNGFLVLFAYNPDNIYPTVKELAAKANMRCLASFPDGDVFTVEFPEVPPGGI